MRPPLENEVLWGTAHYWEAIRSFGCEFTVRDLFAVSNGPKLASVAAAVNRLKRLGHIVEAGTLPPRGGVHGAKLYRCARPEMRVPPDVDPGSRNLRGRRQQQIWVAMRTLPQWTVTELAAAASTDEIAISGGCVRGYVWRLVRAEIVAVLQPKRRAGAGGSTPAVYRLRPAGNSGPKAPAVIRGAGVWDRNTKAWVAMESAGQVSP